MPISWSLQPVRSADIPELAQLAGEAFRDDSHTQLKATGANPYDHAAAMVDGLESWLNRPVGTVELIKAVNNRTGEAVGWVCWCYEGFSPASVEGDVGISDRDDPEDKRPSEESTVGDSGSAPSQDPIASSNGGDSISRLEALTTADMSTWVRDIMPPGTKCMFVSSIAIHPDYHGVGIGSALIRHGTLRADNHNVFCWVHSSDAGSKFFEQEGFTEVRRLELNLDEWAPEPQPGGERWGSYVFRYMRRNPS